jgi:hypothetical protein
LRISITLLFLVGCGGSAPSAAEPKPQNEVYVPRTARPKKTVEKCVFDPKVPVEADPAPVVRVKPLIVSGPVWVPDPCYSMHQTKFSCERALVESPDDQVWLWICASVACNFGDRAGADDYIRRIESGEKKVGLRALCEMYGVDVDQEEGNSERGQ